MQRRRVHEPRGTRTALSPVAPGPLRHPGKGRSSLHADRSGPRGPAAGSSVQLWSSLPRFRGEAKASTWIYRVAFNTALAWKRETKPLKTQVSLSGIDPPAETGRPETLARDQQIERLYTAIRQLPGIDASLALMLLDGLSYQEMAAVVGISENHVGVKLTRIRQHLARSLQGDPHDL